MTTSQTISQNIFLEDCFGDNIKQRAKPTLYLSSKTLPTRCPTPDSSHRVDSIHSSDSESTQSSSPLSVTESISSPINFLASPTLSSPGLFEIDVKPKKKTFKTESERTKFVQDYQKKFKTEMCKNWQLRGACPFGTKCCFAHGKHELQEKTHLHQLFKTKPCKQYHKEGHCAYGLRCQYLHAEAMTPDVFGIFSEKDSNKTTKEQRKYRFEFLKCINDCALDQDGNLDQILNKLPHRNRLPVFNQITLKNSMNY